MQDLGPFRTSPQTELARLPGPISPRYGEISARFPKWEKAEYSGDEFLRERKKANMAKHKNHNFRDYHSFGNFFGCITAILSIPFKMVCLWCGKYSRQCKMMRSGARESQPALSYEHRNFYKGFRGKARSRKPGLCEEALRGFTMNPGWEEGGGWGGAELTLTHIFLILTDRRVLN